MLDIISIIEFIIGIVGGLIGAFAYFKFFRQKEARLFSNIQRPIAVMATENQAMDHEVKMLQRVGFFKISSLANDERAVDMLSGHRLLIIGYSPDSDLFRSVFNAAKSCQMPIIVYSGPTRITPEDMAFLQSYTHHSMCNTPLRLVSDVFAIMSTYPEDK